LLNSLVAANGESFVDKETKKIGSYLIIILGLGFFAICASPNSLLQIVHAQTSQESYSTFLPSDEFTIPNLNGSISFASGGSYENATLENNTWRFEGFALDTYTLNLSARGAPPGGIVTGRAVLPYLNDNGAFSVSVQDCNVTITAYEPLSTYYPHSGWLNYTIIGTGEQTFDFHFPSKNFYWNTTVDGQLEGQNETWTSANNNLIIISGAKSCVSIHYDSAGTIRDLDHYTPTFPWVPVIIVIAAIIIAAVILIRLRKNKGISSLAEAK
jgi:hypothetical protein